MNNQDLRNHKVPKEKYAKKGWGHMHWALALLVRIAVRFCVLFVLGMAGVTISFGGDIIIAILDIALWFALTKERYRDKTLWTIYNWFLIIKTAADFFVTYFG